MASSRLIRVFPFLDWLSDYDLHKLKSDLVAGITVALVLVPQSMAYAQLAGLPAYYGLYASFLPPMVAALFGSSRRLATGPVAVVSIMTATALEPLATAGSAEFIGYAVLLAFLVGLFQLALGVLKLGLVVNLLSHPVIVGFTNAAALVIGSSQIARLLGIQVDSADHWLETMVRLGRAAFTYIHWPSLG
ncbi:MAG TPA: sodium-independent anion transporter, partial [Desulfobulbus sp.]|nr:sodium-independent anion transporter [Desulfobulbus sp.]